MTMSDETPRDRAWLAVIDLLADASSMSVEDISEGGNVHSNTARAVLHVAEDYGVVERETEQGQTYFPVIGALGMPEDREYRRAVMTLIAESKQQ